MKQVAGWWLPQGEVHLVGWLNHPKNKDDIADGRTMYQGRKIRAALSLCKSFRTALDVGGHCGTWSYYLAQRFDTLHAFEPVAEHRECFARNVTQPNVTLYACALGDREGSISIATTPGSSGDSHVSGDGDIPMHTLDSFEFTNVDLIKIDVEGAEDFVLRGGMETIMRCRPMIVVEQKGHGKPHFGITDKESAVHMLEGVGMKALREPMSGDWFLGWPD